MAAAVAALMMAANPASSLGTHGRIPSLHRPDRVRFSARVWFGQIADIFGNSNFLTAIAGAGLSSAATALTQGLAIYFSTFVFALPATSVMWLVATQALSAPPAFLLATWAARRWGKRRAYLALFAASLVFVYGPLTLRLARLAPANGPPKLLPVLLGAQVASGLLIIASSIINTSMVADVIEENQVRTGRRSEGLVLFSDRLMLKLASALATVLRGLLLAWVRFPMGSHAAPYLQVLRSLIVAYLGLGLLASAGRLPDLAPLPHRSRRPRPQSGGYRGDGGRVANRTVGRCSSWSVKTARRPSPEQRRRRARVQPKGRTRSSFQLGRRRGPMATRCDMSDDAVSEHDPARGAQAGAAAWAVVALAVVMIVAVVAAAVLVRS